MKLFPHEVHLFCLLAAEIFFNFHVGSLVIAFIGVCLQNELLGKNEFLTFVSLICEFADVQKVNFPVSR